MAYKKIPFIFLTFGLLLLTLQCEKKELPPEEPTPPLTNEQMILGEWEWQYSLGGAGDTSTPATWGIETSLFFRSNDSVDDQSYHIAWDTTFRSRYHYEFAYHHITNHNTGTVDSAMYLYIDEGPYWFTLNPDTLTLDTRYLDGNFSLYVKKHPK